LTLKNPLQKPPPRVALPAPAKKAQKPGARWTDGETRRIQSFNSR
jgi:hypothetical protein